MPRVTHVNKARGRNDGSPRRCHGCGQPIEAGRPYKWFKIKQQYGGIRRDFHADCRIRSSMMTTSPTRQALAYAQEAVEDAMADTSKFALADYAQVVRDYAEAIRELGEMKRESAQNLEEGFGHPTYQSEELEQAADSCDSMADELDSTADEIDGMDDPDEEGIDEEEREERRDAVQSAVDEACMEEPEV